MNLLAHAVDDYIKLRRGLGFKLKDHEDYLHKFRGLPRVAGFLADNYPTGFGVRDTLGNQKTVSWARQMGILRKFALYRRNADLQTEVPPIGLLPFRSGRALPSCTEKRISCA